MEQEKGAVKIITLAQFKEDVSPAETEDIIKGYANLANLVPSLKDFRWGTNTIIDNGMNREYTHVFELIFEDSKGAEEYMAHPDHDAFAKVILPRAKQFLAIGYTPTKVLQ